MKRNDRLAENNQFSKLSKVHTSAAFEIPETGVHVKKSIGPWSTW